MPVPAVAYKVDPPEIAFTHDDAPHVVSLTPYLENPDDAIGVCYRIWNAETLGLPAQRRVGVGGEIEEVVHEGVMHFVDRLAANNEVTLQAENDNVHVTLEAELLGPGAVMHGSKISRGATQQSEQGVWLNRTVSLEGGDSAGDVEAVVLVSRCNPDQNAGQGGCRGYGSTTARFWYSIYHTSLKLYVMAAPNGQYQVYTDGAAKSFNPGVLWWEWGYIKSGYGLTTILNYADEVPGASSGWETRSTTTVPVGAEGLFAIHRDARDYLGADGKWFHGLRAIGSSENDRISPSSCSCDGGEPVLLDGSRQFEYSSWFENNPGSHVPELWITAYTMAVSGGGSGVAKAVANSPATEIRSIGSGSGIARAVASAAPVVRVFGSASATAKLVASAAPGVPTDLAVTVDAEDVIGAAVIVEDVLGAEIDVDDVIGADVTIGE